MRLIKCTAMMMRDIYLRDPYRQNVNVQSHLLHKHRSHRRRLIPFTARYCYSKSSVRPFVRLSVRLSVCPISLKRSKIGPRLLLMTSRKSHTCFRLVPKSTTLDDLEGPLRTLFQNTCVFRSPPRKFD